MTKFLSDAIRVSLGALAALPLIAGAIAHAQAVRIETSDLDLSKPAQVAALNVRIERAADRYCGDHGLQDLGRRDACRAAFKDEAMVQLRDSRREQEARTSKPANGAG